METKGKKKLVVRRMKPVLGDLGLSTEVLEVVDLRSLVEIISMNDRITGSYRE